MAAPNEKLAQSLAILSRLQRGGRRVFQARELTRVHRARLVASGFLLDLIKGWLIASSPGARSGDSTPWYASFWEFCARYANDRFGDAWHVSPEQSLLLYAEETVVPKQVVIYSPKGTNHNLELPFGTSLYDLKQSALPAPPDVTARNGLRLFSPAASLVKIPESFFTRKPIETQVVLASLRDTSDVLRLLLNGGHSVKAGLITGAFRRIGRPEAADEVIRAMTAAGYDVRESDPYGSGEVVRAPQNITSPLAGRMRAMWPSMRDQILENFPKAPGLPLDTRRYLARVDEIYQSDAYHSLSIEGYAVTPELIDRVQRGGWRPDQHDDDRRSRDALAARGYWQAFQQVKAVVTDIIGGTNSGTLARASHADWYRQLFQPFVAAGVIAAGTLGGYRNDAMYLRTSRYVPPRWEAVRDAMPALFDLLEQEPEPSVRAALGHWLFGYIHPYPDGNGRMARFLMNAMLASGGYPWTVIRVDDRAAYLAALDRASIDMDIVPFAAFIAERVRWSLEATDRTRQQR